jgi:hypothetical protein
MAVGGTVERRGGDALRPDQCLGARKVPRNAGREVHVCKDGALNVGADKAEFPWLKADDLYLH